MTLRILVLLTMLFFICGEPAGQTTTVIVVMGSSTAAGAGASKYDSAWVGRLIKNVRADMNDGKDTIVYNIALGGTTTYVGREMGFVPPSGYLGPDPERNIDKALSYNPDIILVNYPSNDVANNMTTTTTMANYEVYNRRATDAGKKIYFLTSQPRNTVNYDQQVQLRDQKAVIMNTYPSTSINVWDILVAQDGLSIDPAINADGTHVTDAGHRRIFQTVAALVAPAALLPVKLNRFTAEVSDKKVNLFWETLSELNNSHFEIEHSTNGSDFKKIGRVKGKGNSSTRTNYSYSDKDPAPGKNFYRLKQVDQDGKFSYTQVVRVTFKTALQNAVLYPIPASSMINLKIAVEKREPIRVSIYDRSGNARVTYSGNLEKGENILHFPLSTLPSGNYFMQIKNSSAMSKRSFVKL